LEIPQLKITEVIGNRAQSNYHLGIFEGLELIK